MKQPWEPPQSTQKITPDPAMKVPEVWRFYDFSFFPSRVLEKCEKSKKRHSCGRRALGVPVRAFPDFSQTKQNRG